MDISVVRWAQEAIFVDRKTRGKRFDDFCTGKHASRGSQVSGKGWQQVCLLRFKSLNAATSSVYCEVMYYLQAYYFHIKPWCKHYGSSS